MKMYLATLALCLISNIFAMEDDADKVAILVNKRVSGTITKLRGIVAQNKNGHLECQLTHDSSSDKCSGTLINKGYSRAEWYDQSLDEQEAQEYYKQLTENLNK